MARIVMCWELGGDLGHVARMKPLAEALHRRGHHVSFITRETLSAGKLLDPARFRWFQAPYQSEAIPDSLTPTLNMSAVMHNCGFNNPRALSGRLQAWRNLYSLLGAELLVFDHSPTAMLAARGLRIPRIVLGTGFGIPPATQPLPPFESDKTQGMAETETAITGRVNEALRSIGAAPIDRIAELYQAEARVFFTFKELDHYGARAGADYWGPTRQDGGVEPQWPTQSGKRVFAYLKPFKTLEPLLDRFRAAGHPTLIYLSKGTAAARKRYAGVGHMVFSDKPVDLRLAVPAADLVVCHSGHGTISAALLAGKPLLLLPLNMEQLMLSRCVAEMGAGLAAPALMPEGMSGKFQRLLAEPAFTMAARGFAERYRGLKVEDIPERFAALAERVLASEVP